ncbi:MAG: isochorismate synthase, partial [Solirubrobacteraceae bacterium]
MTLTTEWSWLDVAAVSRLADRIDRGRRRARASGLPVLVSATFALARDVDPSAVVCASRGGGQPWFCFEQPDRERIALAALGSVRTLEASGEDRFEQLAERWRALAQAAVADPPLGADQAPGAGLTA